MIAAMLGRVSRPYVPEEVLTAAHARARAREERDWPADLERALVALASTSPERVDMVVVADGPSEEQAAGLDALAGREGVEVVRTSERLGQGAALNVGLRRA